MILRHWPNLWPACSTALALRGSPARQGAPSQALVFGAGPIGLLLGLALQSAGVRYRHLRRYQRGSPGVRLRSGVSRRSDPVSEELLSRRQSFEPGGRRDGHSKCGGRNAGPRCRRWYRLGVRRLRSGNAGVRLTVSDFQAAAEAGWVPFPQSQYPAGIVGACRRPDEDVAARDPPVAAGGDGSPIS